LVRALELTSDPAERPSLELALAEAFFACGRYDDSISRARSAQAGFASLRDAHNEALSAAQLAESLTLGPAEYEEALSAIEPYYRRLDDSPRDLATLARVLSIYNNTLSRLGRSELDLILRQITVADRLGDQSQIARALIRLSVDQSRVGGRLL